ncbi:MAG: TrkA C-terminal domain-containing protein [Thermoleophilia bacterium]|nr:TrkA C-terminal domain-containing protein [Thermoleophilia bacterium]
MIALLTFFLLVVASLLATRLATVALTLTGMSQQVARFQARSALSGAGFTTSESEVVVNHPVRRRIIMFLMLIGSAGLVTAVATLSISFVGQDSSTSASRLLLLLLLGCLLLLILARNAAVDGAVSHFFGWLLTRYTDLELRDYAGLLHLAEGHSVLELHVDEGAWLCSRTLGELQLPEEGLAVLGIDRATRKYIGAPRADTEIRPGDTLICYGVHDALVELSSRKPGSQGDLMHQQAVRAHRAREAAETDD